MCSQSHLSLQLLPFCLVLRKGLLLVTGSYLYTRAPLARTRGVSVPVRYHPSPRDGHVLLGGETLQYGSVCMLLTQTSPPLVRRLIHNFIWVIPMVFEHSAACATMRAAADDARESER